MTANPTTLRLEEAVIGLGCPITLEFNDGFYQFEFERGQWKISTKTPELDQIYHVKAWGDLIVSNDKITQKSATYEATARVLEVLRGPCTVTVETCELDRITYRVPAGGKSVKPAEYVNTTQIFHG